MTRRLPLAVASVALAAACSTSAGAPTTRTAHQAGSAPSPSVAQPPAAPTTDVEPIAVDPSEAAWTRAIDRVVGDADVSVAVGSGTRISYLHLGHVARIPASVQKLLTTMVALDTWGPSFRFPTLAVARRAARESVVRGDLWIVGSGDPAVGPGAMARLARRIARTGIERIAGSVVGDMSAFTREWWAPGWVPGLSRSFVTRTTALAFEGNAGAGLPEEAAAASLTRALEARGVEVAGAPAAGEVPGSVAEVARIRSAPLSSLLRTQNHGSVNFIAETLLKALGALASGGPGSTAAGAALVEGWAAERGVRAQVRDGSGLSHQDRISARGLVTLLLAAPFEPWGEALVGSLPGPGEGTIGARLAGLPVRAKTGTLFETPVSSLAGYVCDASGAPVAFAVVSRGLDKTAAIGIEDAIVRILAGARV